MALSGASHQWPRNPCESHVHDGRSASLSKVRRTPAIRPLTCKTKKVDAQRTRACRRGNGMSHRSAELLIAVLSAR